MTTDDTTCPHATLHGPTPTGNWICNKCGQEINPQEDA